MTATAETQQASTTNNEPHTFEEKVALRVLQAVQATGSKHVRGKVANVLTGSVSAWALDNGYHKATAFGSLEMFRIDEIIEIIDDLVEREYLETTGDDYPVLQITDDGRAALSGTETPSASLPWNLERKVIEVPDDRRLMESLRALRLEIAREDDVPVYRVFGNQTLLALSIAPPMKKQELTHIPGLGEGRIDRYGDRIIACVSEQMDTPAE